LLATVDTDPDGRVGSVPPALVLEDPPPQAAARTNASTGTSRARFAGVFTRPP
jgi:hypothetical protein